MRNNNGGYLFIGFNDVDGSLNFYGFDNVSEFFYVDII